MTFFIKHIIIYLNHFGFPNKISTSYAMLDLVTAAINNIDHNLKTRLVLLDLKKPIDTVCHN